MKKYYLVVLCALLFIVTGCGKKQVTCSTTIKSESGVNITLKAIGDLDEKDTITDVTVIYDFSQKSIVNSYCEYMKKIEDPEKGITVSCSGSEIIIKGMASIAESDKDSVIGLTKEQFINKATHTDGGVKYTCK